MAVITNKYGYPDPLYQAVLKNTYSPGDSDITVTELIDAPKPVELKRRHAGELTADVSDMFYSVFGQLTHTLLEQAGTEGMAEERLYTTVNGWKLGGQFDYIDKDGILWDWKTVSVYEVMNGIKPEREQQLNVYAHLARANGHTITGLRVGFIFRDWRQGESRQASYPPHQALIYPIRMWEEDETARFIEERVKLHQAARGSDTLPDCTPEERWQRDDKWAVTRPHIDRAVKLFDDKSSAEHFITDKQFTDATIVHREGFNTRCVNYCGVNRWCQQFSDYQQRTGFGNSGVVPTTPADNA